MRTVNGTACAAGCRVAAKNDAVSVSPGREGDVAIHRHYFLPSIASMTAWICAAFSDSLVCACFAFTRAISRTSMV